MPLEIKRHTVPHLKALIRSIERRGGHGCGSTFISAILLWTAQTEVSCDGSCTSFAIWYSPIYKLHSALRGHPGALWHRAKNASRYFNLIQKINFLQFVVLKSTLSMVFSFKCFFSFDKLSFMVCPLILSFLEDRFLRWSRHNTGNQSEVRKGIERDLIERFCTIPRINVTIDPEFKVDWCLLSLPSSILSVVEYSCYCDVSIAHRVFWLP